MYPHNNKVLRKAHQFLFVNGFCFIYMYLDFLCKKVYIYDLFLFRKYHYRITQIKINLENAFI